MEQGFPVLYLVFFCGRASVVLTGDIGDGIMLKVRAMRIISSPPQKDEDPTGKQWAPHLMAIPKHGGAR
jgi:hypothetical protein